MDGDQRGDHLASSPLKWQIVTNPVTASFFTTGSDRSWPTRWLLRSSPLEVTDRDQPVDCFVLHHWNQPGDDCLVLHHWKWPIVTNLCASFFTTGSDRSWPSRWLHRLSPLEVTDRDQPCDCLVLQHWMWEMGMNMVLRPLLHRWQWRMMINDGSDRSWQIVTNLVTASFFTTGSDRSWPTRWSPLPHHWMWEMVLRPLLRRWQ